MMNFSLFTVADKKKIIYEDGSVLINLKSMGKFKIAITGDSIIINACGVINTVNKGFVGAKTIPYSSIMGVQYKKPGFTTGYIQFSLLGSNDGRGGVNQAMNDENTITFLQNEEHLLLQIKEFVEYKITYNNKTTEKPTTSNLDEIKKLKDLLDINAITQDEFDAKKKQLLGL